MRIKRWDLISATVFSLVVLAVLMFVAVKTSSDMRSAADQINEGQKAIVCILAINPDERTTADVARCTREAGLVP